LKGTIKFRSNLKTVCRSTELNLPVTFFFICENKGKECKYNNSRLVSKHAVNHSCLVLSVPRCKFTLKAALQTRYVRAVGPQCTNKRQLLFRSSSSVIPIEDNLELWQNKFLLCGLNYNIYK